TVTPGYLGRLDMDILFDGERPSDWSEWTIRMHVWSDDVEIKLTNGDGVRFEEVDGLEGASAPVMIPVLEMDEPTTERLRNKRVVQYLIDLAAPGGAAEDYFAGSMRVVFSPPERMLT